MRIEDLNWMDVESYFKTDDRVMVVLGACEQHGYLSLQTDTRIPLALADAASQKTGVLVAPPLPFGVSPYFLTYPGTISIRSSVYLDIVEDIIRSLYGAGAKRILILNGHGGNQCVTGKLIELANALTDVKLAWYSWWTSHSIESVAIKHGLKPEHANWLEAFAFTKVADLPSGEKIGPEIKGLLNADQTRAAYQDGSFGGKYDAGDKVMEEVFAAALADVLYLLEF